MRYRAAAWEFDQKSRTYEARLDGVSFSFVLETEGAPLRSLIDVALRDNAKRRFLFVSKLIGRHIPTTPASLRATASALTQSLLEKVPDVPTVFFGMSETATTFGQVVFREWVRAKRRGLYIETTRHRTGGELAFQFSEGHSHASEHVVHLPNPKNDPENWFFHATQAVIVDDEATTGRTAAALLRAYRVCRKQNLAPDLQANLVVILQLRSDARFLADFQTITNMAAGRVDVEITGIFPAPPRPQIRHSTEAFFRQGVRHGLTAPEQLPPEWSTIEAKIDERILVLGSGEYGFQPFLFAEHLESMGAETWLQATTRSPILLGGAIEHARAFPSFSGEGFEEHLYNVPDDHPYDRVFLCTENLPPAPSHPIWGIPRIELPLATISTR